MADRVFGVLLVLSFLWLVAAFLVGIYTWGYERGARDACAQIKKERESRG